MSVALDSGSRRTLPVALVLSLLLHLGLFAAATWLILPGGEPPEVIRIALIGGGGGGNSGKPAPAAASAPAAPAPAAPAAAAPAVPPPVVAPQQPAAIAIPQARRPKPERPRPPAAAVRPARPAPQSAPAPVAAVSPPAAGIGAGTGSGSGTGAGQGPGSGGGSGGGRGGGTGAGRGAGHGNGGDLRALCLSCPEPQYPRIARVRGWEGVVDVEVSIGADGAVTTASVARSSGHQPLDDAALESARRSRFQLSDASGDVRGRIPYRFRLTTR